MPFLAEKLKMTDQDQEAKEFLDPFWLEYRKEIQTMKQAINTPNTYVGEELYQEAMRNTVFQVYNQLIPPYGSLIALMEYDEIGKRDSQDYFSSPTSRQVILKAFSLLIEDHIKSPYPPESLKKYKDYAPFFNRMLKRLRSFEAQIREGIEFPNFVNSLGMIFQQEVNNLEGVENFNLKKNIIRKRIADYLPELEQLDGGKVFQAIKEQISKVVAPVRQGENS